jgi:hypothetical protein
MNADIEAGPEIEWQWWRRGRVDRTTGRRISGLRRNGPRRKNDRRKYRGRNSKPYQGVTMHLCPPRVKLS